MREISNVEINTLAKELDDVLKGARLQNEFVYLEDMELLKHVIYNICANWEDF